MSAQNLKMGEDGEVGVGPNPSERLHTASGGHPGTDLFFGGYIHDSLQVTSCRRPSDGIVGRVLEPYPTFDATGAGHQSRRKWGGERRRLIVESRSGSDQLGLEEKESIHLAMFRLVINDELVTSNPLNGDFETTTMANTGSTKNYGLSFRNLFPERFPPRS